MRESEIATKEWVNERVAAEVSARLASDMALSARLDGVVDVMTKDALDDCEELVAGAAGAGVHACMTVAIIDMCNAVLACDAASVGNKAWARDLKARASKDDWAAFLGGFR